MGPLCMSFQPVGLARRDASRILEALLPLSRTPDAVDLLLTEIAALTSPEAKAAYLAEVTGSEVISRIGGTAQDNYLAITQALIAGHITLTTK